MCDNTETPLHTCVTAQRRILCATNWFSRFSFSLCEIKSSIRHTVTFLWRIHENLLSQSEIVTQSICPLQIDSQFVKSSIRDTVKSSRQFVRQTNWRQCDELTTSSQVVNSSHSDELTRGLVTVWRHLTRGLVTVWRHLNDVKSSRQFVTQWLNPSSIRHCVTNWRLDLTSSIRLGFRVKSSIRLGFRVKSSIRHTATWRCLFRDMTMSRDMTTSCRGRDFCGRNLSCLWLTRTYFLRRIDENLLSQSERKLYTNTNTYIHTHTARHGVTICI